MKTYTVLGKTALALLLAHFSHGVAFATIYNAADDFSSTSNPTGVWSYGWSPTLGGAFNVDTDSTQALGGISGLVQWRGDQPAQADGNPSVFKNTTASPIVFSSITLPAGALALHPGSAGQDAVIQFTAPSAGQYSISAIFTGQDSEGPTSTDVHVYVGTTSVFDNLVNGFVPNSTASLVPSLFNLSQGETVDFIVGNGGNGFNNDATGLQADITAVPESTTMIAGLLLLLPFGAGLLRTVSTRREK